MNGNCICVCAVWLESAKILNQGGVWLQFASSLPLLGPWVRKSLCCWQMFLIGASLPAGQCLFTCLCPLLNWTVPGQGLCLTMCLTHVPTHRGTWSMLQGEYLTTHLGMYGRKKSFQQFPYLSPIPKERWIHTLFDLVSDVMLDPEWLKNISIFQVLGRKHELVYINIFHYWIESIHKIKEQ